MRTKTRGQQAAVEDVFRRMFLFLFFVDEELRAIFRVLDWAWRLMRRAIFHHNHRSSGGQQRRQNLRRQLPLVRAL